MSISEFNYIESGLWFLMAALVLGTAIKHGRSGAYFGVMTVAFFGFLAFAVSDTIEAKTGAWWRPRWLLVLKTLCVLTLIGCYIRYQRIRRRGD